MPHLSQHLSLLENRGLVRVTLERETPIVRFKHALTREATYNSMLQARRAELHRAAAQTLTALYPQPDLEMVLTVAEHWQRGSEDGSALETLLPHAQRLIYTGRGSSLTTLLERLQRENLIETQQRDLDIALADAHAARGEFARAQELYAQVLAQPSADARRPRLLHGLGVAAYHLNDNVHAIEYQRASMQLAEEAGDVSLQARAANGLGLAFWNLGDYVNAEAHLQASRTLGLQLGESIELANAEYGLAGVAFDRGDYATAIVSAERARAIYDTLGHATLMVRAMQLLGACYYGEKDLEQAADVYQRAIAQSRALGDTIVVALGLGNLAEVYADWDQLDQAAATYAEALLPLRAFKYESLLAYDLASLAGIEIRRALETDTPLANKNEWLARAQANVNEALDIATRIQSQEDEALARRVLAELNAAHGDFETARQNAQQAVALLEHLGRALELERARATQQRIWNASASGDANHFKEAAL